MPLPGRTLFGLLTTLLLALVTAASAAQPASAASGGLAKALDSCSSRSLSKPFARWLDPASYFLAPGGSMEGSLDGWTLTGGAKRVAGSEPFGAAGDGRYALSLPAGSSATTPMTCVGVLYPSMRYFAANEGGLLSVLRVEVLYETAGGNVVALPLGLNVGGKAWSPLLPTLVGANVFSALRGGQANVAFRFTPVGRVSSWKIDDVFVDPYARH